MRLVTPALALLLAAPAVAQAPEPDTTDWHLYYPLEIGNEWQYSVDLDKPLPFPDYFYYRSHKIVGAEDIEGERYGVVRTCYRQQGEPAHCSDSFSLIRYDEALSTVVERYVSNGEVRYKPWAGLPCNLALPFSAPEYVSALCPDGYPQDGIVGGDYGAPNCLGNDCVVGTFKAFAILNGAIHFGAGLGPLLSGYKGSPITTLLYARIDGVEYGTQAIIVESEDDALPEATGFTVFPNPIRGAATLRFALDAPQRLTLEAFDVRGRLVRTVTLGMIGAGEQALPFGAGALPPGAYRLRLAGNEGFAATRGVIVLR